LSDDGGEPPKQKKAKTDDPNDGDNDHGDKNDPPDALSTDAPPVKQEDVRDANSSIGVNDQKPHASGDQPGPPQDGAAVEKIPSTPSNQPIGGIGVDDQQYHSQQQMQQQAQHHHISGYQHMMGGMTHPQYHMMPPYSHYPHAYPGQPMMMQPHQLHPLGTHSPNPGQHQQQPVPSQPYAMYGQPQQPNEESPNNSSCRALPPFPNHYGGMMAAPMHMMPRYGPPAGMFFGHYPAMPGATGMLSPMMSYSGDGAPPGHTRPSHIQAPPPRRAGIPLSLTCDDEQLSEYQMLVRKQLEIFEALPEDVESNTQGRKKQVILGQVGIRCRHCSGLPLRQRGRYVRFLFQNFVAFIVPCSLPN
jgi:hypothetical protein